MLKLLLPGFDVLLRGLGVAWLKAETPHLCACLARAERDLSAVSGFETILFAHFGVRAKAGRDLPIAAVSALALREESVLAGDWVCIDPVFLQADVVDSLLFPGSSLGISLEEAHALLDTLRGQFPEYEFFCATPDRWYLRAAGEICLQTSPVSAVSHGYINRVLPQGDGSRHWLRFLTEVQMLFFEHAVNARRETAGQMPVNSVWLYGAGALPERLMSAFSQVYSNEWFVQGLARLGGVAFAGLPVRVDAAMISGDKSILMVDTRSLDLASSGSLAVLQAWVRDWELNYFEPVVRYLRNGVLDAVELDFCNGYRYRLNRWMLLRVWRSVSF